ncbi:MAG: adenylosuccinate lyase [Candidatus Melainabacteria bacterium LEY3_CP_29_8]|nr:MAG: adenylosuccinate lyase [Candidatus Melainabacteria bacterium LEY3_CP_29_8]
MIERYTRNEMKNIWDLNSKYNFYLQVELAACQAYYEAGQISKQDFENIKSNAKFDINRINEIEKEVNHDVIAFLTNVNENVGESSRYIHMGLTSSDVIDTALGLQFKEANKIIENDILNALNILKEKAFEYKNIPCIGRSHGILAEPMFFGLKFLNWYNQLDRAYKYFKISKEDVEQGQISGPVGTYSNISPDIEKRVCEILELKPCKVSTQVIPRDVYAYHLNSFTMIAKVIEQAATEIRHLQKTEILEVEEGFKKGQKGSSAMPHKKNPISSENLCGLARLIKNNFNASLDNIVLWHERDISHSSVERIIFPDTTILINYILNRFINTIENLNINKENMLKNINLYGGIVFSQKVMLKLTSKGLSRENAYKLVQKNAHKNFGVENGNFKDSLLNDKDILNVLLSEIEKM